MKSVRKIVALVWILNACGSNPSDSPSLPTESGEARQAITFSTPTVPVIASGGTNSVDRQGMHDLALASNSASYRAGGGQLYIHEVGWLRGSEEDRQAIAALFPKPPIFETGWPQAYQVAPSELLPYWPGGAFVVCVDTSPWPLPAWMPVSAVETVKQAWSGKARFIGVYYTPNDSVTWKTPFSDPQFDGLRQALLAGGALCTDAPPQYYLAQTPAYRQWVADEINWATSHGVFVVSSLFPMESVDFWSDTQFAVSDLAARGAYPNVWAVNGYYGTPYVPTHPIGNETDSSNSMYTALQLVNSFPRRPGTRFQHASAYWMCAENDGGANVVVDRTATFGWETFTVNGALQDWHAITIQANNADYFSAECGGGLGTGCGYVNANRALALGWETFIIHKLWGSSGSTIVSGDAVALLSAAGYWCTAEGGGGPGSVLKCNRTAVGGWETFYLY
jgi:hypothetical protein